MLQRVPVDCPLAPPTDSAQGGKAAYLSAHGHWESAKTLRGTARGLIGFGHRRQISDVTALGVALRWAL